MTRSAFRLVLLISCAHALVHIFELALPSVEQMIAIDFGADKQMTGRLGMAWRLPFGMLALAAGILADRYGSRRVLIFYLLGCVATSLLAATSQQLWLLFLAMFLMGCFASIYHPAGLSLISRVTTAETRGRALGWHGIFGSVGITAAPLGAGLLFETGTVSWRGYYTALVIPALVIAGLLLLSIKRVASTQVAVPEHEPDHEPEPIRRYRWTPYILLVSSGALSGFVYGGFLHFLQRYLDGGNMKPGSFEPESFRNYLAAVALLCAVAGQAIAGRLARPGRNEWLQVAILAASMPCLLWMSVAEGWGRLAATCLFAFVHFMSQPVYNSLIAQLVPAHRRSTGYGFSNMVCFSLGGVGALVVGLSTDNRLVYGGLAGVVAGSALLAAALWWVLRPPPQSS